MPFRAFSVFVLNSLVVSPSYDILRLNALSGIQCIRTDLLALLLRQWTDSLNALSGIQCIRTGRPDGSISAPIEEVLMPFRAFSVFVRVGEYELSDGTVIVVYRS